MESSIEKVKVAWLQKGFKANEEKGEKAVGGNFFIPKYQRGYRWTGVQVKQLLDDIYEFTDNGNQENAYCLQPLVVQKDTKDDRWIVIDGQQRLTTIYIALACLKCIENKSEEPFYEMEYESKRELRDCLEYLGKEKEIKLDCSDIDKYYMTNAYLTVREWVKNNVNNPEEFATKLKGKAFFIWYEVSSESNPIEIFTRINMGKIPLTNAELIKALLLKKDNFAKNEDIKGEQAKISMAWDFMEHSLHQRDFWLFVTNDKDEKQDVRINLVFDILAHHYCKEKNGKKGIEELERHKESNPNTYLFLVFAKKLEQMITCESAKKENKEYIYGDVLNKFWQEIDRFFQMLRDWYEEREWYHLIGYSVAAIGIDRKKDNVGNLLYELSDIYCKSSKTSFTNTLKAKILKDVMGKKEDEKEEEPEPLTIEDIEESFDALRYNGGESHKKRIHKILLLFNVVTVQRARDKSMAKFPFHEYKKTKWNLEHIHSVTTQVPSSNTECKEWVDAVKKYLGSVDYFENDEIKRRLNEITVFDKDNKNFTDLYKDVTKSFSNGLSDDHLENGIMNLALLDEEINKSYKNDIFPLKRKYIMEKMGCDNFVPICTRNVFLKYYTEEVTQYYVWDKKDRENYFKKMCKFIFDYLPVRKDEEA